MAEPVMSVLVLSALRRGRPPMGGHYNYVCTSLCVHTICRGAGAGSGGKGPVSAGFRAGEPRARP